MSSMGASATDRPEVVQRVHAARKAAGLTVEDLAIRSAIPYSTLRSRLGYAARFFSLDELARIAEATGVQEEWLLVGQAELAATS